MPASSLLQHSSARKLRHWALGIGICVLLLTTHAGEYGLLSILELGAAPASPEQLRRAQAVVVIGGRAERVRKAANLSVQTGLPILVSGRGHTAWRLPENEAMRVLLRREYGIQPRWEEDRSVDTEENAKFTWCILRRAGVQSIVLVTDAQHMFRARRWFSHFGFRVASDPLFIATPPTRLRDFRPSLGTARSVALALQEYASIAIYFLKAPIATARCD